MAAATIGVYLLAVAVRLPIPTGVALITSVGAIAFGSVALVRVKKGQEASRTLPIFGIVIGSVLPLIFAMGIVAFIIGEG